MKQPVSDRRLRKWLAEDPSRLEQYLERFPEETERIDALTSLGDNTRRRMDEVYVPPRFAMNPAAEILSHTPSSSKRARL